VEKWGGERQGKKEKNEGLGKGKNLFVPSRRRGGFSTAVTQRKLLYSEMPERERREKYFTLNPAKITQEGARLELDRGGVVLTPEK